jgi:hypothetical protein
MYLFEMIKLLWIFPQKFIKFSLTVYRLYTEQHVIGMLHHSLKTIPNSVVVI